MRTRFCIGLGCSIVMLVAGGCAPPSADTLAESSALNGSCDPARATGAVVPFQRALLDTIATAEGTYRADANDGYDVAFGYHYFASCAQHPGVVYCSGSLCSDASGRYQFLSTTWRDLGLPNFYPDSQDRGAMMRVASRGASVPANRAMSYAELSSVMDAISWEWASLPPGRYGQPSLTMDEIWSTYAGFVRALGSGGGQPGPAVTVGENADGRLELFYARNDGALFHEWQTANGWSTASQLGGRAARLAVERNADGRLEMFYVGTNHALYHNAQSWPNGGWGGEAPLGGRGNDIAVGRNADGRLEVFYVGTNSALYHNWQTAPNGTWAGESALGGAAKQVAVGVNADGRLEVFYVGTNDSIYHNAQKRGGWGGEAPLGGQARQLVVGRNDDGRLEVVYIGTNGALYHRWQLAPNGGWSGEAALGGSAKQVAIGQNADGRLEVFYVGTNDALYHNAQNASGWGGEAALGGEATRIAVGRNADGRLELFYVGTNGALYHNWQVRPNGGWHGEAQLDGGV